MSEFILEFKKLPHEDSVRRPLPLSRGVAEEMAKMLKDREKHITRYDENGNLLEMIDKSEIKGIRKTSETPEQDVQRSMVCEYGTRHPHRGKEGFEDCNCKERFKVSPLKFERLIHEKYGVDYSVDITPEMQNKMELIIKKQI